MCYRFITVFLVTLVAAVSVGLAQPAARPLATYTNPVARNLPDPYVIRVGGVYYAYGTNAAAEGYRALSSPDLVHWTDRGFVFRKTADSWARDHFWAPCVVAHNGRFYLFYSALGPVGSNRESHRICVAVADSPLGPFRDLKAPMLDIGKAVIDADVFVDKDKSAYLYYALDYSENDKQSHLYVARLSDDFTQIVGQPVYCLKPEGGWEGIEWAEGPCVLRHENTYILLYSARGFFDPNYAIGCATANSPLGPWKKSPKNPILHRTAEVSGPGHNSVIASPDGRELFCAYHTHRKLEGGHERDLAIDRMTFENDPAGGVVVTIHGPTRTPQPMPSGAATQPAP